MAQEPLAMLSPHDVGDVEALRAANNETLGFMPMSVMADYLKRGGGVGIRGHDGLLGYALYDVRRLHVRLIHLCVAHQHRGSGYAERLVDAVVDAAKSARVGTVKLTCSRDYGRASAFWQRYGFVALEEVEAKTDGARLMVWYLGVDGAAQQDMFASVTSDDKVRAAIDAQIFFQLHGPESAGGSIARGLQADFLSDSLDLYITREMFNEINRAPLNQREQSRRNALAFPQLTHDTARMQAIIKDLKRILPSGRPREESDIRQIAMTAASDVAVFLTRDEGLLDRAGQIKSVTAVDVMHPDQLIVRLDEVADGDAYRPMAVSGSSIAWRRVVDAEVAGLRRGHDLLGPHERKGHFVGQLDKALSQPKEWRTEGLWSEDARVALRSLQRRDGCLVAALCRATSGPGQRLFIEYAAASLLHEAVGLGCREVRVEPHAIAPEAVDKLTHLGFVDSSGELVRMCPAAILSEAELREAAGSAFDSVGLQDLERRCSPVVLRDGDTKSIMVPIKTGYARALFNIRRAASDMFGADEKVLLGWENVYFRKKSLHRMIQPPARILWYESGGQGIVAISHLDDVEIGQPKDVFRNNRLLGTLGWRDIREMCRGKQIGEVQDIMALRFSHTHLFRTQVSFAALKRIYGKHKLKSPVVQSPSRVPRAAFLDIYRAGFPGQASA